MVLPEMVENLYEDNYDGESIVSSLPDIEFEEDAHSLREKQKRRRQKRKQKRLKLKSLNVGNGGAGIHLQPHSGGYYSSDQMKLVIRL